MKRHSQLFPHVRGWFNLLRSCHNAARGKRFRPDVARFLFDSETELLDLQYELDTKTYVPGAYRTFLIYEPKLRQISAAPFRDRVVHHAVCRVIEPLFDSGFIFDSYACRKRKGVHAAIDRAQEFQKRFRYVLKADIRKFFPCVDHAILKQRIRRRIKDPDLLWLIDVLIDNGNPQEDVSIWFPGDDLLNRLDRKRGLPIGNQTSQFFANVLMDQFDHFVKETLRVRGYVRYVDDFLIFHDDKRKLAVIRQEVRQFLEQMRLRLHEKKSVIFPRQQGVDFLGFKVFADRRRLAKENLKRMKKRLRKMQKDYREGAMSIDEVTQRIQCWIAHASHADSFRLRTELLEQFPFSKSLMLEDE